jgi:hypothetical protein
MDEKQMRFAGVIAVLLVTLCSVPALAQAPLVPPTITFTGIVYDQTDSLAQPAPIVVNRRTGTGHAFMPGATFRIQGLKTDTFLVTAGGYEFVRFCYADSAERPAYYEKVGLTIKTNQLNAVTIFPVKDLQTIKQDRQSLGVKPTGITQGPVDAISSPITFLYERFSREGQSKALVAELENRDRINAVLKDLFRTYNRAGVMNLPEADFDAFILYLNMPEQYLKTATDYQLAVTIKQRYDQFMYARGLHNQNQK